MANVRLPSSPLWLMVFYTKPNPGTIYSHLPQSQKEPLITVIFNNFCYWANPNLSPSTASRSFKGISGIFSLSRCPNKAFVFTWQIEKSTFYNCPCPKQRLVLSASTPVGIRSAFAVGVRHQWHQSWAGHSLRSHTAPSWKLRCHREEHPGQSPPPQLQALARWEAWGAGLWALHFISKKDKQHQILPEDVLITPSHHSSFYFSSYFPSFLRSPQWVACWGSCFHLKWPLQPLQWEIPNPLLLKCLWRKALPSTPSLTAATGFIVSWILSHTGPEISSAGQNTVLIMPKVGVWSPFGALHLIIPVGPSNPEFSVILWSPSVPHIFHENH